MKKILTIAILLISSISFGQVKVWKVQGDGTPAGISESKVAQMISDSLSTINLSGYTKAQVDSITAQIRSGITSGISKLGNSPFGLLKSNDSTYIVDSSVVLKKSDSTIANRVTANEIKVNNFFLPIRQTVTSGSSVTIANNTTWLVINPATLISSLSVTLPASPTDNQIIDISFGGTITTGTVVTTLTLIGSLIGDASFSNLTITDKIRLQYNSSNSKWYE